MQLVLIRHGKTDYRPVDERGLIGNGRDLAPLGNKGIRQAEECARRTALKGVELILSSPYTRALQTAAIISRITQIPLRVEIDLREWQPDRTHLYGSTQDVRDSQSAYDQHRGVHPEGETPLWESTAEMIARLRPVFDRYLQEGWEKLAVVAHGMVIGRLTGIGSVQHCLPYTITYTEDYTWHHWVEDGT